jgi:Ca2+-binding RTX toxin-like protein
MEETMATITGNWWGETLNGTADADRIDGLQGDDKLFGLAGNDTLIGGEGADELHGGEHNDALYGGANGWFGGDTLFGDGGNDFLDGGAGADTMWGGTGDDTFIMDHAEDFIVEFAGEGFDTVFSSVDVRLTVRSGLSDPVIERFFLTGTAYSAIAIGGGNHILVGNSVANLLDGGVGNDTLDGGAGNDRMIGGTGDDTFVVDNSGDVVIENAGEGTDTVHSAIHYTLAANVEKLVLTGAQAINGTGNELDNDLTGNAANNVLNGGAGVDKMRGGGANDSYWVDNEFDEVIENDGEGVDLVFALVDHSLALNVENLQLFGTSSGTGNNLDNEMRGSNFANTLDGGDRNDRLFGEGGDDHLIGGSGLDLLTGGAGVDTFVFNLRQDSLVGASDQILDFVSDRFAPGAGDKIDLRNIDANTTLAGDQQFQWIGNNNNFVQAWGAGQLRCNGGFVEGDTDGILSTIEIRIQVFQTDNELVVADFHL